MLKTRIKIGSKFIIFFEKKKQKEKKKDQHGLDS